LSGVGTVVFNPVMMDGKPSQPVEFTRVLHVPSLQNNLLFHHLHRILQNHLNWFTLICMVLSLLPPVKDTATGSPSFMIRRPPELPCA